VTGVAGKAAAVHQAATELAAKAGSVADFGRHKERYRGIEGRLHEARDAVRDREALLNAILAAAGAPIIALAGGVVTTWNDKAAALFGIPASRAIGAGIAELLVSEDHYGFLHWIQGRPAEADSESAISHGSRTVTWKVTTARDTYGGSLGRVFVGDDVTELHKIDGAILQSRERYRAIIDSQLDMVCRWTPDGVVTFVNDAFCKLFGIERSEMLGQSFAPLIHETDRDASLKGLSELSPENPMRIARARVRTKSGEVRWNEWQSHVILGPDGKAVKYQGIGRDITEMVKQQEMSTTTFRRLRFGSRRRRKPGPKIRRAAGHQKRSA